MRKRSIAVAVIVIPMLAIATVAVAESPFVGTWKLNLEKSKFIGSAPLEWTDIVREIEGDQFEGKVKIVLPDGSTINEVIVWPRQGGVCTFLQGGAEGVTEITTLISSNEWLVTRIEDGKQISTMHLIVSQNGKTMRYTLKKQGVMDGEAVFDKQ